MVDNVADSDCPSYELERALFKLMKTRACDLKLCMMVGEVD